MAQLPWGSRVFAWGGGGEFKKRAQLTGPLISYYELWRQRRRKIFRAMKMVNFFSKHMAKYPLTVAGPFGGSQGHRGPPRTAYGSEQLLMPRGAPS